MRNGNSTDVSIIGCGAVTQQLYALQFRRLAGSNVKVVADVSEDNARAAAGMFHCAVGSVADAISAASLVIVATPPSSHLSLAKRALEAGRDVCVEKPFATSLKEAEELVSLARQQRRRLYVAHFRRHYPKMKLAREFVDSGLLGRVNGLQMHEGDRFNWMAASDYIHRDPHGGVLFDTGSHTLDMGLFASGLDETALKPGCPVVRRDKSEPAHEIDARFTLEAAHGGIECRLQLSRVQRLSNLVRIRCERGSLEFDVGYRGTIRIDAGGRKFHISPKDVFQNPLEAFVLQYKQILDNPDRSPLDATRFVNQIAILEFIHRS